VWPGFAAPFTTTFHAPRRSQEDLRSGGASLVIRDDDGKKWLRERLATV